VIRVSAGGCAGHVRALSGTPKPSCSSRKSPADRCYQFSQTGQKIDRRCIAGKASTGVVVTRIAVEFGGLSYGQQLAETAPRR
jgi:hypothetical protein